METIEQFVEDGFLKVVVQANAKKTKIAGEVNGLIKVLIKAPAEKNKANRELIKFLTKLLGRKVELISGEKSKQKVLKIL